jgi:Leucine-rich repeat (LRR) protein
MLRTALLFLPALAVTTQWIQDHGGTARSDAQGRIIEANFRASWIADSDLAVIASLRDLLRLDLSHTRVTDPGFRDLKALEKVSNLNLYYAEQIGDGALAVVKNWRALKRLNLRGTKVTDAGIAQLAEHPSLEGIDVGFSLFTDGGFEPLTTIPNLKELAAGGNKLTDTGINALRLIPNLRVLDLNGVQRTDSGLWSAAVTDRGLEAIATLSKLEELYLRGAKITDGGSARLAPLQLLRVLDLSETQVSALAVLSQLPRLERLSLYRCARVNDSIIPALSRLKWVDLTGTKVSAAGIEQLRRTNPDCRVLWQPAS